jgi:hypothetical protein
MITPQLQISNLKILRSAMANLTSMAIGVPEESLVRILQQESKLTWQLLRDLLKEALIARKEDSKMKDKI